jgi:hypothetical protein
MRSTVMCGEDFSQCTDASGIEGISHRFSSLGSEANA